MTGRDFLKQALKVHCKLDCALAQIQSLKDLATRITPVFNGTPTVSNKCLSKLESAIVNLQSQSEKLGDDALEYLRIRDEIAEAISKVKNDDERLILEYRYLTFKAWEDIAKSLNKTKRSIYKLHNQALDSFEKIFSLEK